MNTKCLTSQVIPTFEVGYKWYYREMSEFQTEYYVARNSKLALRKFVRAHKAPPRNRASKNWEWWEDEMLIQFRFIRPVSIIQCSTCNGQGWLAAQPPQLANALLAPTINLND